MKKKTTRKAVSNEYRNVISVPYCDLQTLLRNERVVAYTTRQEGWGADIYQFGDTAIATGYAPFGNVRPSYEVNKKYEDMARAIANNYNITWEEQQEQLNALIKQYIQEVTQ